MTDRELLELAAKAVGIKLEDDHYRHAGYWVRWDPLTNDTDALRLAVRLEIDINHDMKLGVEMVYAAAQGTLWSQAAEGKKGNDPYAATRRAIVRAAAEIGRKMT